MAEYNGAKKAEEPTEHSKEDEKAPIEKTPGREEDAMNIDFLDDDF